MDPAKLNKVFAASFSLQASQSISLKVVVVVVVLLLLVVVSVVILCKNISNFNTVLGGKRAHLVRSFCVRSTY